MATFLILYIYLHPTWYSYPSQSYATVAHSI